MCGRYCLTTPAQSMQRLFGFMGPLPNWPARYNIAPTQLVPIVRQAQAGGDGAGKASAARRELVQARWGLVPFWAKEAAIGAKMINARAEGIA